MYMRECVCVQVDVHIDMPITDVRTCHAMQDQFNVLIEQQMGFTSPMQFFFCMPGLQSKIRKL